MTTITSPDLRRGLPAVDTLLAHPTLQAACQQYGQRLTLRAVRETLAQARTQLAQANHTAPTGAALAEAAIARLSELARPSARAVFNLTGTVIHTNLGRSLLAEAAIEALVQAARHPLALEYDLDNGARGDRDRLVEALLCELTGAEAATVVNNNAGAVLLALGALGAGREALISRGELIEIGGAFRMPDIMQAAGCELREVGATNRTHAHDFENAISERTGLIVKAYTSNYAITGFTGSVPEAQLARIAHTHDIPFLVDLGSGALTDFVALGLPYEAQPSDAIAAGADVVTFSGDKLLGGPQAGIIAGKKKYIEAMKKHPLARAMRVDKMTFAALEATLKKYRDEKVALRDIPILNMISASKEDMKAKAEKLAAALKEINANLVLDVVEVEDQIGGGSAPMVRLPGYAVAVAAKGSSAQAIERKLRKAETPIVARIQNDQLLLCVRTIFEDEFAAIAKVFK